jgi:hypothetical protein
VRSADHVNPVYPVEIERMGAPDCKHLAVPIKRDPL